MPTRSAPAAEPTPDVRVLDLFSGAGGLTEGFHCARGFRTVQAVEMDTAAAATYSANFGDVVYNGDIASWLASDKVPEVDVVVGGPPCQGFSTLGKQDVEDARNELWREYIQAVILARPRYFVLENVAAFMQSPQFKLLRQSTELRGRLCDYRFDAQVLNAADYGAAQSRRRTIIIGHRRDVSAPGLPEPTHSGRHVALRSVLNDVRAHVTDMNLVDRVVSFQGRELPGRFQTFELHLTRNYTNLSQKRIRSIPPGGNRMNIPLELRPACWRKHTTGAMDVMGRLSMDRPSVTIRTEFWKPEKGRYLHPSEHRALTHFEAARIQGFRDNFLWVGSKTSIGRQIGNAVPIPLATAIARHLKAHM